MCLVLAPVHAHATTEDPREAQRPSLAKRALGSFLDDETGDGRGLHLGPLAARFEIVSSGALPAPMLHFWTPDIGGTTIDVHASASYSPYKYQYYDLQLGLLPHVGARLPLIAWGTSSLFPLSDLEKTAAAPGFGLYASARYRDYPREDFYGIGPDSLRSDRTDYRLKDGLYEGVARLRVGSVSFMGRAGILETSILSGDDSAYPDTALSNDEATAPGLVHSPDFVHLSGGAWLELRDEPGNPHRGGSLGVAFSRFDDREGSAYQWNRFSIDARQYIALGSHRHVLAFRQVASLDEPDPGRSVPFYMQSTLGGSGILRGYGSFRFRDDKLLVLAGEYRFELRPRIELALLYDAGKVFPAMSGFDLRDMRHSFGAGLRLKSVRSVKLRFDVLRGPEVTRVDIKLGPSF